MMTPSPGVVRLYTTRDAADILAVHQSTVLRRIHSGELRAVQVGMQGRTAKFRIRADDLQAYIDANTFDFGRAG